MPTRTARVTKTTVFGRALWSVEIHRQGHSSPTLAFRTPSRREAANAASAYNDAEAAEQGSDEWAAALSRYYTIVKGRPVVIQHPEPPAPTPPPAQLALFP